MSRPSARLVAPLLLAIAMVAPPPAARADFTSVGASITTLPPLPACGGTPFCAAANDYIRTYNGFANGLNEINRIGLEVKTYARYPQQVKTNFSNAMNQIANVMQQTQGLNYQVGNIEQQVSQIWPNYRPGTPLAALNAQLNNDSASSIVATLKGAGLLSQASTDSSVSGTIAAIRAASANAVNPTQATQVEVQLLSVMWEQQVKEQRLLELRASEEAQHDLREVARDQQQLQYDQSLVQALQTSADGTPPVFTPGQMNAILSPATHSAAQGSGG